MTEELLYEGKAKKVFTTDDENVREHLGDGLDELFDPAYALRNSGVVSGRVEELKRRLEDG